MATESGLSEGGYALVVSFPDQSPSFCHGFEAGGLFARMKRGDVAELEETTRVENREVIARMAYYLGWSVAVAPTDVQGWDTTTLVKEGPGRDWPNPHGLRIVTD